MDEIIRFTTPKLKILQQEKTNKKRNIVNETAFKEKRSTLSEVYKLKIRNHTALSNGHYNTVLKDKYIKYVKVCKNENYR